MSHLLITTINHHKISIITEDDEIKPYSINVIAPSQPTNSKDITTGIHKWDWAEVEKLTNPNNDSTFCHSHCVKWKIQLWSNIQSCIINIVILSEI